MTREQELFDLLAEKAAAFDGDFDLWYREGDEEDIGLACDLVVSIASPRVVTRAAIEHRLERIWREVIADASLALEPNR